VDVLKTADGRKIGSGEYVFRGGRDSPIVEIRRALAQVNDAVPFKFHDLHRSPAS
jgi:hypothetical protein